MRFLKRFAFLVAGFWPLSMSFVYPVHAEPLTHSERPSTKPFVLEGNDRSEEYKNIFKNIGSMDLDPIYRQLSGAKILFVPGFFSDNVMAVQNIDLVRRLGWSGHFEDYLNWCAENDLQCEFVPIESEAEPIINAEIIRDSILQSNQPIILISQSKGAVDTLTALLEYPELQEHIRFFLSLNAPFQGTPLADEAVSWGRMRDSMAWLLETLGGSIRSVESLRVDDSQNYLRKNDDQIRNILERIPFLSVAAYIKRDKRFWNTHFALLRNHLEKEGYINDGLLPWQSSVLPHSNYIVLEGVDHATTIQKTSAIPFDRIRFLETCLQLSLGQTLTR